MSERVHNLLTRGMRFDNQTVSGISFSWDGDWFRAVGTATSNIGWRAYRSSEIPVKAGKRYTLSVEFADGMPDATEYVSSSFQLFSDFGKNTYKSIVGMNRHECVAFDVDQATLDAYHEGFQIWGPIIKGGATVDLCVRYMLVEGTTPAAWAPAEGETLSGGGALMSANLLDGVTATVNEKCSESGGAITSVADTSSRYDVATWATTLSTVSENQTLYLGASAKWSGSASTTGTAYLSVEYADSANYTNAIECAISGITTTWQRISLSAVLPSGMHITGVKAVSDKLDAAYDIANPVLSYDTGPITLASCTHTCKTTEWVPKGEFYVQQPDSYADEIQLTSYDGLYLMSKFKYSEVTTTYPATLEKIVTDICTKAGLTFDGSAVSTLSYQVPSRNPDIESMTGLQVASCAAQAAGCYLRRSNTTGGVVAGWYDTKAFEGEGWADGGTYEVTTGSSYGDGDAVDGGTFNTTTTPYSDGATLNGGDFDSNKSVYVLGMFSSLTTSTDDVVITGVQVTAKNEIVTGSDGKQTNGKDGETSLAGKTGYVLSVSGNPLVVYGQASTVANQIYARVGGMRFRSFNATCRPDPSVEPGDPIEIEDRLGRVYRSYVTKVALTLNGNMTLACGAKTPARNSAETASATTQAIVQARNEVNREKTERELAQEQLQKVLEGKIDGMAGLYSNIDTLPDGSHVYCMSDKPTLAASKIIWKMAAGAIGVSTDGGKTYSTGLTAEGDALMNRIYANGISADYISTGMIYGGKKTTGSSSDFSTILNTSNESIHVSTTNSSAYMFSVSDGLSSNQGPLAVRVTVTFKYDVLQGAYPHMRVRFVYKGGLTKWVDTWAPYVSIDTSTKTATATSTLQDVNDSGKKRIAHVDAVMFVPAAPASYTITARKVELTHVTYESPKTYWNLDTGTLVTDSMVATNAKVTGMVATNANVSGKITANSGTIAGFSIYGDLISGKNVTLRQQGLYLKYDYNNTTYDVGGIGVNSLKSDTSKYGLVFDLEYDAQYMAWAWRASPTDTIYTMKWTYAPHGFTGDPGRYQADTLNAGCDIDMHNWKIRNLGGGVTQTFQYTKATVRSDGTVAEWGNGTMTFTNGILTHLTYID